MESQVVTQENASQEPGTNNQTQFEYTVSGKNVLGLGLRQMHAKRKEKDKQKWGGGGIPNVC